METKEITVALNSVKEELKKGLTEEVKEALAASEVKSATEVKNEIKGVKEELLEKLNAAQAHVDKLDVKLQESKKLNEQEETDVLKKSIRDSFEEIKKVEKGEKSNFKFESKDMTLGANLTGDAPKDYNLDVVQAPSQMINVSDLATTVPIAGGTYVFYRESLAANNIGVPTEGAAKGVNDYTYTEVTVNTDYIAGTSRYSKKMRNNLPFLENSLSIALRRDYYKSENSLFHTKISGEATASTVNQGNEIERLLENVSLLAANDFMANGIVINPVDYFKIITTEKSTGAGYGLPGVVSIENGILRVNGIPVYQASWCPADKYYVGDWSRVTQVVTEGFSFAVSDQDKDNFSTNNITARVEQQTEIVVEQPDALYFGDFTAV